MNTIKVIFLDIDGVLNMYGASCRTFMKDYGQHIEPHLVQRLNYIVEQTKCKIVISSSWRSDMQDLEKQLKEQGFKYWTEVVGKTTKPHFIAGNKKPPYDLKNDYKYNDRGEQINKWLEDTNFAIKNYVVIDDEISDIDPHIPNTLIIQTDYNEGMLHKDTIEVIKKLNEE